MLADGVDLVPALERVYGAPLPALRLTKLRGDASTRSYYRVERAEPARPEDPTRPNTLIVMRLPEDALGSDEAVGDQRASELPFVDVHRLLAARGIAVPRILADDTRGRVLLLEDLGDETFGERLARTEPGSWPALYAEATSLLATMHERCAQGAPDQSIAFGRSFDRALLRWELDHFREWGLEAVYGELPAHKRALLDARFEALCDRLMQLPRGFVHRDYQSRNLMYAPSGALTVIDFQDALQGPVVYDLVALLCDSYVALSPQLQRASIDHYARLRGLGAHALREAFDLVAVQRKLKDAGRFVFIDRVRGNDSFLPHVPQSLRYAGRALAALGDSELHALLTELMPGFPDVVPAPPARTGSARL